MLDYLIIGGGIAGLSTGARLSRMGSVLLIEAEDALGYHTSGRSAAVYEPDYGAPATLAVAAISGPELNELGVLSPRGLLVVGKSQDKDAFETDMAALKLTQITPDEACAKVPILDPSDLVYAAYSDVPKDIDTDLLLQLHAKRIRAQGGEIRLKSRVTAIERIADGWAVQVGDTRIEARHLVNAAGSWADGVAQMAGIAPLGLKPLKRSMAVIPAPVAGDIMGWPMLIGAGETWYAKPQGGALLVSPCDQEPVEPHDAWPDDMVLAEGLARFEGYVTTPVTRLQSSWAGIRTKSPDGALVLGPDPSDERFVWVAGQGGQGFLSSSGAAMVIEERLGGAASGLSAEHLRDLSPARFR